MKAIFINGSPRKNFNTAKMLGKAMEGAASIGAECELVNLFDYEFTGCRSCFACQMKKNSGYLRCQIKDSIYGALDTVRNADGIVFGSPIYFFDVTAQLKAFLERLYYPYCHSVKQRMLIKIDRVHLIAILFCG